MRRRKAKGAMAPEEAGGLGKGRSSPGGGAGRIPRKTRARAGRPRKVGDEDDAVVSTQAIDGFRMSSR